jgi:hypothetical protein
MIYEENGFYMFTISFVAMVCRSRNSAIREMIFAERGELSG